MNSPEIEVTQEEKEQAIIVGIGASAGGLEALRELVPDLPIDKRVVYILAQHLDPKHSSMLVPILSRQSEMVFIELNDNHELETGQFYIIPPGMDASYANGHIRLQKATGIGPKPSVDQLFISIAEQHGERCIGIILSGTGADGAHGIRSIKAAGGITMAQLESTARFDSMPHSAINTGNVDLVMSPKDIALQIRELLADPDSSFLFSREAASAEEDIQEVLKMLLEQTGSDFRDYKRTTLLRRVERRMTLHKFRELKEYCIYLKEKPEELYELHNDILISVTSFFRDPDAFRALHQVLEEILPQIGQEIRIWVAGCATGEEAYSIAILLSEYLGNRIKSYKVQIFGTDLYDGVLSIARQACYPKAAVAELEPRLLDKYFVYKDGAYQLSQSIRNLVLFARHDLVRDPPFSHLQLITCRNVLIYFNQNLQRNVLESFHYGLEKGGILFLGKSETVGNNDRLFATVDRKARIYRRRGDVQARPPYLLQHRHLRDQHPASPPSRDKDRTRLQDVLDNLLINVYQPACLLLNDHQEIIYMRGEVNPFLKFSEGRAALQVMDLIHPDLRQDLRGLLYKARRSSETLNSRRLAFRLDGQNVRIVMRVRFFAPGKATEGEVFILIFETHPVAEGAPEAAEEQITDSVRLRELEEELRETRESLQTTIEELETANEELQSTYEEAQSTNEELYTSTEELQTSNEELQSTNEELRTVNQELSVKSSELEAANHQFRITNAQLIREIEERKRIEQHLEIERAKLATIFHSQPNWISICSTDGIIREVNPAGLAIMETDSADELIGKTLHDFATTEFKTLARERFPMEEDRAAPHRCELEIRTLQNRRRWIEVHTVPIMLDNSEPHVMSIIVDHTVRKLAQTQLAERQQELAHIMRLNTLGEMASSIAHELNQPLTAIGNYVNGCERRMENGECSTDEVREVLSLVSTQVHRAGEILRYTKDFTRKDQEIELARIHINDVVQEILYLLETTEQFRHINLKTELEANLGQVLINKIQIEQVMVNLLQNAVDSMIEAKTIRTGELLVCTRRENSEEVRVLVADSGTGLAKDFDQSIFRPFHSSKKTGMGMGLAISRSIIEAHGGKLEATNHPVRGAIFSFTLPTEESGKS